MAKITATATLTFGGSKYPVATATMLDRAPCDKCRRPGTVAPQKLSPRCHPDAGVVVHYFRSVLALQCLECGEGIVAMPISDAIPEETHYEPKPGDCAGHSH